MSQLNVIKSTNIIKPWSRVIITKSFHLSNSIKSPFTLHTKNFSSTSLANASTYDYSKHSNETKQMLQYNKITQLNSQNNKNSLDFVKKAWNEYLKSDGFDAINFKNLEIVEEESRNPGKVVMKFTVKKVRNYQFLIKNIFYFIVINYY